MIPLIGRPKRDRIASDARVFDTLALGIAPDSRMKGRSLKAKLVLATSLALIAPCLWAQDGLEGALARANLAAPFGGTLAVADLDSDNKADGAVLLDSGRLHCQVTRFRIELHLSARRDTHLTFESTEVAQAVAARDIDEDGDTDVIVGQPFTQQLLRVWLNDGRGGFRKGRFEEFPPASAPTRERLKSHLVPRDRPALRLPPQRGFQIVMVTAGHLPGRRPSTGQFEVLPIASALASGAFAQDASRSPPLAQSPWEPGPAQRSRPRGTVLWAFVPAVSVVTNLTTAGANGLGNSSRRM